MLGGKYQLLEPIGQGAMGTVWRAWHLQWQAPVAVKVLRPRKGSESLERCFQEVRIAAGLRSAHVVQVLDHGWEPTSQRLYLVMELLDGETLASRLARSPLAVAETCEVVHHVALALHRAHSAGVVHRDLKPENIFLADEGTQQIAKVLDFGIAAWIDRPQTLPLPTACDSEEDLAQPRARGLAGTPGYMSPEQRRGQAVDERADIWALAVIACECLTGRRRVGKPPSQLAPAVLQSLQGSVLTPEMRYRLQLWLERALHPSLSHRPPSALALALGLHDALGFRREHRYGQCTRAAALQPVTVDSHTSWRPPSSLRRRVVWGLAALGCGVLGGLLSDGWAPMGSPPSSPAGAGTPQAAALRPPVSATLPVPPTVLVSPARPPAPSTASAALDAPCHPPEVPSPPAPSIPAPRAQASPAHQKAAPRAAQGRANVVDAGLRGHSDRRRVLPREGPPAPVWVNGRRIRSHL